MPRPLGCQFCRTPLDAAQEFGFHVQTATAADRNPLTAGRRLPHAAGKPLQCCRECETLIVSGRCVGRDERPAGVRLLLSAVLLVGTAAMTLTAGKWLADGG